ncbi:MAG: hypothetical protein CL917_17000 [Deltaproteobacteria bacterium]|nr:hypothetical protein [Deltaproteobacteria bacterium]
MKSILFGLATILVLLVGGFYFVYSNLDEIVRTAIEEYGSQVVGTSVSVSGVSISLTEGKGTIKELRVAEPKGFGSGSAISFDEIELGIDIRSLTAREPIIINLVRVIAPSVNYVINQAGESNLAAIQKNIARSSSSSPSPPEERGSDKNEKPLLISIRSLDIEGGSVSADLSAVGLKATKASLPAIRGKNLGGSSGAPPTEIATQLAQKFVGDTIIAVSKSQIAPEINRLLNQAVGKENSQNIQGLIQGLMQK